MELLIEANQMESFLSMRPKVFLAASDARSDLGAWCDGDERLCDVWILETTPRHDMAWLHPVQLSGEQPREGATPLQPPATLCVLAARSPGARDDLEAFRRWWADHSPSAAPPVHSVEFEPTEVGVLLPLLRAALAELQQSATQQGSLAAQLYLLRTEHEQTRTALHALQAQQNRFQQGPQLLASLPPAGPAFRPDRENGTVRQYLPIAAEGLACFDLHLPRTRTGRGGMGHLIVGLHALDRHQPLGFWRRSLADLRAGWARFAFPEALTLSAHDLELSVTWSGPRDLMPDLSLADVGDWHEMQARTGDRLVLPGGLALMLWRTAPGTKLKDGMPSGFCLPGQGCEFRLSQRELARALLSSPNTEGYAGFPILEELPQGGLQLHPLGKVATVAYLPNGCMTGTQQVSATVKIDHPEAAGHVQYALLVTRHEPAWEIARLTDPGSDRRVLAFSGWETIPPDQLPYCVSLRLPKALDRPAHLVLATRTDESTRYAWAHWLEFRMNFRDPAATFESQLRVRVHEAAKPNELRKIPA